MEVETGSCETDSKIWGGFGGTIASATSRSHGLYRHTDGNDVGTVNYAYVQNITDGSAEQIKSMSTKKRKQPWSTA